MLKVRDQKGFTLIELLIVIAIIAILAAIAIPQFAEYRARGIESGMVTDAKNAATTMESLFADCQTYVGTTNTGNTTGPGTATFNIPAANCASGAASNQNVRISSGNVFAAPGALTATGYNVTVGNAGARAAHTNVRIDQTGTISWF